MTTFSGPLNVKRPFEETTAATVDVSGTASYNHVDVGAGNAVIQVDGTATFVSIDGTPTFTGVNTTAAAQGTANSIPASCEGFVDVNINGTIFTLVYFTKS